MKSKKFRIKIRLLLIIIVVVIGVLSYYNYTMENPLKHHKDKISITINEGEGLYNLLDKLESEGILRNKTLIKLNLKLNNKNLEIVPGTYEIKTNISLSELIDILKDKSNKGDISITIPEGYDIDEIADLLEEQGLFSRDDFIQAVKEYILPSYIKADRNKRYNLEGYLFPDTYFVNKDITPEEFITLMINEFEATIKSIESEDDIIISSDELEKIVTIASLIEEEAEVDEERKLVSSVIYNRLNKGMKLEFCSTINYAWGEHLSQVLNKHLEIDSPYNTYKNAGLPVGPITNSGKKSLIAAIEPANTDYLYFMLLYNQGGKHHFSTTGEEHERVKLEEEAKAK